MGIDDPALAVQVLGFGLQARRADLMPSDHKLVPLRQRKLGEVGKTTHQTRFRNLTACVVPKDQPRW